MRFFLRQLLFLALWSSGPVLALGLGDIRLFSYLNEPLDAEIRLISAHATTPSELKPRLVAKANKSLGYEPDSFSPDSLRFEVVYPKGRPAFIRVTSTRAVREPVVAFALELIAPNIRIQRDYTLLLDPSPYIINPRAKSAAARPQATAAPVHNAPPARKRKEGSTYGPVRDGDTLSHIALRTRPSRDISIHRMTQALFRRNPDAFINGNINLLRKGARLEVPTPDEIRSAGDKIATRPITPKIASREQPVTTQKAGTTGREPEKPTPSKAAPEAEEGRQTQDVLRLVSDDDAVPEASRTSIERKHLKRDVGDVSQDLKSVREENRVLMERVARMEELLRKMGEQAQRMVVAQQQIVSASIAAQRPASVPASKTQQPGKIEALSAESQPLEHAPSLGVWAKSLLEWLWWISLLLAVALVVVALLLLRSKDEVARARQASLMTTEAVPEASAPIAAGVSNVPTEDTVAIDTTPEPDSAEDTEAKYLAFLRTEIDTNAAYGRYSAAKHALDRALGIAPNDIELVLKAFEIARLQEDVEDFAAWVNRAGADVAKRAPSVWRSISEEARTWIPDHPVWRKFQTTPDDGESDESRLEETQSQVSQG